MKDAKKLIIIDWYIVKDSPSGLVYAAPADLKIKIKGTSVKIGVDGNEILDKYYVSPVLYSFISKECADTGLSLICVLKGEPQRDFKNLMDYYDINISHYFRNPPNYIPRVFNSKI